MTHLVPLLPSVPTSPRRSGPSLGGSTMFNARTGAIAQSSRPVRLPQCRTTPPPTITTAWPTSMRRWRSMPVGPTTPPRPSRSTSWRSTPTRTRSCLQDGLADLYFKIGRIREAVTAAQEQVKRNPDDIEAHALLGKVYLRSLGDMQGPQSGQMLQLAIAEYEKLAQLKPNDVETHLLLGQLYGLNHDSAKAEAEFKAAQKIDANSEEVVLNMARLYSEQGDTQRAVDTLKLPSQSTTAQPGSNSPWAPATTSSKSRKRLPQPTAGARSRSGQPRRPARPGQCPARRTASWTRRSRSSTKSLQPSRRTRHPRSTSPRSSAARATTMRRLPPYKKAKPLAPDSLELSYNEALIYDALGRYDDAIRYAHRTARHALLTPTASTPIARKPIAPSFSIGLASSIASRTRPPKPSPPTSRWSSLGGDYVARGYQGEVDAYRDAHQWKDATAVAAEAAAAMPKDHAFS